MTLVDGPGTTGRTPVRSLSSWLRFLAGFAVLYGVLAGTGSLDTTGRWGLLMLAAVVLAAVAVERVLYRVRPVAALRSAGLGRPRWRALLLAAVVSGVVLLVHPLYAAVSGSGMSWVPGWSWVLVGVFAFHGVAEELVWRGFAFRRLREGRSFWRAVWWTMPLIAVTHLPIVFTVDPVVGIGAMVVAAVTSIPFSYLFETSGGTVWAPAVLHTAIDSFKLLVIPAAAVPTFSLLLVAVSIVVPLLVLAVPRRLLTTGEDSR